MSKINIFSLGGLNENGKNMYVIEVDNDIFVFEAGLQYADEHTLGIDYVIPNIDYLKRTLKNIIILQGLYLALRRQECQWSGQELYGWTCGRFLGLKSSVWFVG